MAQEIINVGLGELTYKYSDDGSLFVYGKATGPDLDLDQQICDPDWLKAAMPQWMATGANVREMHDSIAAGIGIELAAEGDDWYLKSEVVDSNTAKKVERGVLKGYSIGIKNARIVKDDSAPNGRIVAGQIVEVSLVDRPANPTATVEIAKMVNDELTLTKGIDVEELIPDTQRGHGPTVMNQEVIVHEVPSAKDEGEYPAALPCDACNGLGATADTNETCVICNGTGVKQEFPEAADNRNSRAHQDHDGGEPDEGVKAVEADVEKRNEFRDAITVFGRTIEKMQHDSGDLKAVRQSLVNLIKAELDEMAAGEADETSDVGNLLSALDLFLGWWQNEANENETEAPFSMAQGDDTMAYVGLGVSADLIKRASDENATDDDKTELRAEIRKALGVDEEIATYKATLAEQQESITVLKAELNEVREMAAPGGPVIRATHAQAAKSADAERLKAEAARYRAIADGLTDPTTKAAYITKASQMEADAERVLRN